MPSQQSLDSIIFGGAQPLSQRPVLTFSGTKLITQLGDGTAGGSFSGSFAGYQVTAASGVATTLFTLTLPALAGVGGFVCWSSYGTDGTDIADRSQLATFAAVNKAGTITQQVTLVTGGSSVAASGGATQTNTAAMTTTSPNTSFQVTLTASLTTTSLYIIYNVFNLSVQTNTLAGS